MGRPVILDRDGVINENRADHVKCWEEFRFIPGALDAVARLSHAGARVFVMSNQAVVGRGIVPERVIEEIHSRMIDEIRRHGGRIEDVVYCPHSPEVGCECRKPKPGLLYLLALKHDLDLREAVVVGDALTDIDAGRHVGCQNILVLTGRGRAQHELALENGRNGFDVVPDLSAAVDVLLSRSPALLAH